MAINENTTGSDSQVIGSVVILYDNVKAISPDGIERILSIGSPIYANDLIVTEADGRVSIVIDDAAQTQIDLDRMSETLIDEDIFGGVSTEDIAGASAEIGQVQEAFFIKGIDLAFESETPAADINRVTHEGNVSTSPADKVSVIFDHSDYADLNNENSDDPLDNFIDGDDSTS